MPPRHPQRVTWLQFFRKTPGMMSREAGAVPWVPPRPLRTHRPRPALRLVVMHPHPHWAVSTIPRSATYWANATGTGVIAKSASINVSPMGVPKYCLVSSTSAPPRSTSGVRQGRDSWGRGYTDCRARGPRRWDGPPGRSDGTTKPVRWGSNGPYGARINVIATAARAA